MKMRYGGFKYNFKAGNKTFESDTHIMAILNATPDSFYSESRLGDRAAEAAGRFLAQGAEIIDIGGQSTRPTAVRISAIEEMSRVLPVVEAVKSEYPKSVVSVDTFYPEVAQAAIEAGADMINDVSCLSFEDMPTVIARTGASVCIMHDRRNSSIKDLFADKQLCLSSAIKKLLDRGVDKNKILLDGGIGFNKSKEEDWTLLDNYRALMDYFEEYPFLLGTSRKSMFGGEVECRLSATLDSTLKAVKMGVLFVRVHDVAENKAVIDCCKNL